MTKWFVTGVLTGEFLGIIIDFFFPNLLYQEFLFNQFFRQATNLPSDTVTGSVYVVGVLTPILFGGLGALIGSIAYKIGNNKGK